MRIELLGQNALTAGIFDPTAVVSPGMHMEPVICSRLICAPSRPGASAHVHVNRFHGPNRFQEPGFAHRAAQWLALAMRTSRAWLLSALS